MGVLGGKRLGVEHLEQMRAWGRCICKVGKVKMCWEPSALLSTVWAMFACLVDKEGTICSTVGM